MDCLYTLKTPDGKTITMTELELDVFLNRNYRYNDVNDIVFSKINFDTNSKIIKTFYDYLRSNSKENNPDNAPLEYNREPLSTEDGSTFIKKPNAETLNITEALTVINDSHPNLDLVRVMDREEFFKREWDNLNTKNGDEYVIKSIDDFTSSSFKNLLKSYCEINNISEEDILDILRGPNAKTEYNNIEKFIVSLWSYQRTLGHVSHAIANLYIESIKDKKFSIKYNKSQIINFIMQHDVFKRSLNLIDKDGNETNKKISITDTQVELFVSRIHNSLLNKGYLTEDGNIVKGVQLFSELPLKAVSKIPITSSTNYSVHNITGVADLIAVKNGNVEIIDWKTGTIGSYEEYRSDTYRYRLNDIKYQLGIYRRLLSNSLGIKEENITTSFIGLRTDGLKGKSENGQWNGDFDFNGLSVLGNEYDSSFKIDWSEVDNIQIQSNINNYIIDQKEPPLDSDMDIEKWITEFRKKCFGLDADKKTTKEEIAVDVRKKMTKTNDGKYIYEIRYGKSIIEDSEEKLIDAVYAKINEEENNIKNETSELRKEIANCISTESEYKGLRTNRNTIGKSVSWFNDHINRLISHNYELVSGISDELQTILDAHGIILFKNKITGTIRAEVLISGHPNTVKINKNNKYITNHLIGLRDDSDKFLMLNTKGDIATIETAAILAKIAKENQFMEPIEHIHVMNKYLGVGVQRTNESIMHSLELLMQYSNQDLNDISNVMLSMEGNLLNSIKLILNKKASNPKAMQSIEDDVKGGTEVKSRMTDLESLLEDYSIIEFGPQNKNNSISIELLKLIEDFKKNKALANYRVKSKMEAMDSREHTDIIEFYENLLLAHCKLAGYELVSETSYSGTSLKNGLVQFDLIENAGGFTSKTLNDYSIALQRQMNKLKSDMFPETESIWKHVEALTNDRDFNWVKERSFGAKASIYQRLIKFENGDLLFKNPDDPKESGDLTTAEKEFLRFTLKTINNIRKESSTSYNYYKVPLHKAKGYNMTPGQLCGKVKDKINRIKDIDIKEGMKNAFVMDDNSIEYIDDEGTSNDIFKVTNKYDSVENCTDEERRMIIAKYGQNYWDVDIESLLLSYVFEHKKSECMSKMMAIAEAATVSTIIDEIYTNCDMDKKKKFLEEHIEANINRKNIQEPTSQKLSKIVNPAIKLVSSLSLGYNVTQLTYQTFQGVMLNTVALAKKNSVSCNFGAEDIAYASRLVYGTALGTNANKNVVELLNTKLGLNAISTTDYGNDVTSNRNGIMNVTGKLARKFASRPDFYNRMTLFIAQLHKEGIMDAFSVKDGRLEYDFKKDKRFSHLINGNQSSPEWKKEYALYRALAIDFMANDTNYENGNEFVFEEGKINPLPFPLTEKNITSLKDIGDAIYGYYDDSNKALLSHYFVGNLLFHFRTYWTAKKNQYLAPGGVKLRGQYQTKKTIVIENGKEIEKTVYYKKATDENGNFIDDISEEWTTDPNEAYAEVVEWVGEYQEGIIATVQELYNHIVKDGDPLYLMKQAKKYKNGELTEQEKQVFRQQRANIIQLFSDLGMYGSGLLLVGCLKDFLKELMKDSDPSDVCDAITLDAMVLLVNTTRNAFTDFNGFKSILDPVVNDINPIGISMIHSHLRNAARAIMGDETLIDYLENESSATRNMKYTLNSLTGNFGTKEENEPMLHNLYGSIYDLFVND